MWVAYLVSSADYAVCVACAQLLPRLLERSHDCFVSGAHLFHLLRLAERRLAIARRHLVEVALDGPGDDAVVIDACDLELDLSSFEDSTSTAPPDEVVGRVDCTLNTTLFGSETFGSCT